MDAVRALVYDGPRLLKRIWIPLLEEDRESNDEIARGHGGTRIVLTDETRVNVKHVGWYGQITEPT